MVSPLVFALNVRYIFSPIRLLDFLKLAAQPQREGLELQVGVLSARDLVEVHISVAGLHGCGALEGPVQRPRLLPVR